MYLLHKSLYDFLAEVNIGSSTPDTQVDARSGHLLLAQASLAYMQQTFAAGYDTLDPTWSGAADPQLGNPYGTRHLVAHACCADDAALLERTLLDVCNWETIYHAGLYRPPAPIRNQMSPPWRRTACTCTEALKRVHAERVVNVCY